MKGNRRSLGSLCSLAMTAPVGVGSYFPRSFQDLGHPPPSSTLRPIFVLQMKEILRKIAVENRKFKGGGGGYPQPLNLGLQGFCVVFILPDSGELIRKGREGEPCFFRESFSLYEDEMPGLARPSTMSP